MTNLLFLVGVCQAIVSPNANQERCGEPRVHPFTRHEAPERGAPRLSLRLDGLARLLESKRPASKLARQSARLARERNELETSCREPRGAPQRQICLTSPNERDFLRGREDTRQVDALGGGYRQCSRPSFAEKD